MLVLVEHGKHRLSREKLKAAQHPVGIGIRRKVTQRALGFEMLATADEQGMLGLGLALPDAKLLLDPLETSLDDREIIEQQLRLDAAKIPLRIDPARGWHRGILEIPDHDHERIALTHPGEE